MYILDDMVKNPSRKSGNFVVINLSTLTVL
jgi:hypothetical protein